MNDNLFEIVKRKLVVVEGMDEKRFLVTALDRWNIDEVQIEDYHGINDLSKFLLALVRNPGWGLVKTLIIARDAEEDAPTAIESIKGCLERVELAAPQNAFEFQGNNPKVAFMLFPGYNSDTSVSGSLLNGTLEDLCWTAIADTVLNSCVEGYIECVRSSGDQMKYPHKSRLHTYLAGKNEFVGMKIGEASRANAWDWEHSAFQPYRDLLSKM